MLLFMNHCNDFAPCIVGPLLDNKNYYSYSYTWWRFFQKRIICVHYIWDLPMAY